MRTERRTKEVEADADTDEPAPQKEKNVSHHRRKICTNPCKARTYISYLKPAYKYANLNACCPGKQCPFKDDVVQKKTMLSRKGVHSRTMLSIQGDVVHSRTMLFRKADKTRQEGSRFEKNSIKQCEQLVKLPEKSKSRRIASSEKLHGGAMLNLSRKPGRTFGKARQYRVLMSDP
jgi:hypothetical protein